MQWTSMLLWFAIFCTASYSTAMLTHSEQAAVFAFVQHTSIKNYIFVMSDPTEDGLKIIKTMSRHGMLTSVQTVRTLNLTLYSPHFDFYQKTLVVFHVKDEAAIFSNYFTPWNYTTDSSYEKYIARASAFTLHWIMVGKIEDTLNSSVWYIPYNCKFASFTPSQKHLASGQEPGIDIIELYNIKEGTSLIKQSMGSWSSDGGLNLTSTDFYKRRFNLRGTELVTLQMYVSAVKAPGHWAYEEMVLQMARMMNYTTTFVAVDNATAMSHINPDIYLSLLVFGDGAAVGPIWQTPAFLHIRFDTQYVEGVEKPHIRPFSMNVWLVIIYWQIVYGLAIVCIEYTCNKIDNTELSTADIVGLALRPFESLCNQCGTEVCSPVSARIAALSTRALAAVLYAAYSAAIVSFVTVKVMHLPFTSLEGLVEEGDYRILIQNTTYIGRAFAETKEPAAVFARENMIELDKRNYNTSWVVSQLCEKHHYSFVYFNNDLYRTASPCKILQIPRPVFVAYDAYYLQFGSPFKTIFNRILKTYQSSGILKKIGRGVYGVSVAVAEEEEELPQVEMSSIRSVCHVLMAAHGLAVLVCTAELLLYKATEWNRKYKHQQITTPAKPALQFLH